MNKIVINPHNCSREEYEDLKRYLEANSWDSSQLHSNSDNVTEIKSTLDSIIGLAEDVIQSLPQKGNTSEECQRVTLQRAISEFSYTVNGIEESDLIN